MPQLAAILEQFFERLFSAFTDPSFAWDLAALMFAAFVLIALFGLVWTVLRDLSGLAPAVRITGQALGKKSSDINAARASFARSFEKIDQKLSRGGFGRGALSIAWLEFRESLFDTRLQTPEGEIRTKQNSIRPKEFFYAAVHPPRFLGFAANIFVGVGLLLTFVGLVAALREAGNTLGGDGSETTQAAALIKLISTASNKFVTSIFGVGCSLLLKLEERFLTQIEIAGISQLCTNLERGLKFVAPQSLADETLFEARQQTASLRVMGETVATHIGEKLSAAVTPLAEAINEMRLSLEEGAEAQAQSLREGAGTAVSDATGAELRALAQHLSSLGDTMNGLERKIQDSGSVASAQIANAAGELREALSTLPAALSKASESSADSFARLNAEAQNQMRTLLTEISASIISNNERMNEALSRLPSVLSDASASGARAFADVNDEAQRQFKTFFGEAGRRFEENNEQLRAVTAFHSRQLTEIGDKAGSKLSDMLGEASGSLNATITRLNASFSDLPTQLTSAAEESRKIIAESSAETARQLAETQAKLSSIVTLIAGLKPIIEGWQVGAERTAADLKALVEASGRNQRAAEDLTRLLDQRSHEAAQQLTNVAGSMKQSSQAGADALTQAKVLHESIAGTHKALMSAWESHRAKFESVDEDLGRAAQTLGQSVDQFTDKLSAQISAMDGGLTKNIGGLKDATESLAELVEELNNSKLKAAE